MLLLEMCHGKIYNTTVVVAVVVVPEVKLCVLLGLRLHDLSEPRKCL